MASSTHCSKRSTRRGQLQHSKLHSPQVRLGPLTLLTLWSSTNMAACTVAVAWRSTRKQLLPLPRTLCTRARTSTLCPTRSGVRDDTSLHTRPV